MDTRLAPRATTPPTTPGPDAEFRAILDGCARGDRVAVTRLWDVSSPVVHGMAARVLGDDGAAADALPEIYGRILTSLAERPDDATVPWLIQVAHRAIVDHVRVLGSTRAVAPSWLNVRVHDQPDVEVARNRLAPDLVRELDHTQVRVLTETFLNGHSVTETASSLAIHRLRVLAPLRAVLLTLGHGRVEDAADRRSALCDWVGAWTVNALDRAELPRYEQHLAECRECRAEARRLMVGLARVALSVARPAPQDALLGVLAAVPQPAPVAPVEPVRRDRRVVALVPRQRRHHPRLRTREPSAPT